MGNHLDIKWLSPFQHPDATRWPFQTKTDWIFMRFDFVSIKLRAPSRFLDCSGSTDVDGVRAHFFG